MAKYTKQQHEKFLKKMGVHPTQLKKRTKQWTYDLRVAENHKLSNKIPANGLKKEAKTFKSDTHVSAIAYNKGPYMLLNKDDIKHAGKK